MYSLREFYRVASAATVTLLCAVSAVSQTVVSIDPATVRTNTGGVVNLDVLVANVTNLHAAKTVIAFDNNILQLTSVTTAGKFLWSGGETVFSAVNPEPGPTVSSIQVDQAILGVGGVSGSGVLLTLSFNTVGSGTTPVTLSVADLRDNSIPPQSIVATIQSGSVTVRDPAVPTIIYVGKYGNDITGEGTLENPFLTIGKGVQVAYPLDTVQVLPGTYIEAVDVGKSLYLLGSGADVTTIEAPADFATNSAYNYAYTNFVTERAIVHAGNGSPIQVLIAGFTIDGKSRGPALAETVAYSGLLAEGCIITARKNAVRNILPSDPGSVWDPGRIYNGRGIHVRGSGAVAVIDSNSLEEINRLHIMINATDETGNLPAVFPQATVTNNVLTGKGPYAGGQRGIWFNTGAWGTIAGNTVTNLDFTDPPIEPERASGIVVRFGELNPTKSRIIRNNILTSTTHINNKGMYVQGIGDSVVENTITGYRWGIELHDGVQANVLRNTITGGMVGVLVTSEHGAGTADLVTIGGSAANKNTITGQDIAGGGFAISLSFRDPLNNETFMSSVPVDARYNDFGVYTEGAVSARIWDRADTTLIDGNLVDVVLFTPFHGMLMANVKVFLEGPFLADTLSADLRAGDLVPTNQPYAIAPWGYAGTEAVAVVPEDVVDWVLVELRTDTTLASTVGRRAAFLKTTGQVVDIDGVSGVTFGALESGDYFIVIRHRNHLTVMSAEAVPLSSSSVLYDFTTGLDKYYGGDAKDLGSSVFAMWGGDADASGDVAALDRTATWNNRNQTGYLLSDVDLSSDVAALDRTLTWNNRNKFTRVP